MADLRMTPAPLALLRQIADTEGEGWRAYAARNPASGRTESWVERFGEPGVVVTAKCAEMDTAGWIERGEVESLSMYGRRRWYVTEAGAAVLAENTKET